MQQIISDGNTIILRFDKNEDVIKGLIDYCKKQQVTAAHLTGLGACGSVTLSFYDLHKKKYLDKKFDEELEILGITGNIAKLDEKTVLHAHGVFGKQNYQTIGGHVKELIVSATCEIHLTILNDTIKRAYDKKTGLNLLQ